MIKISSARSWTHEAQPTHSDRRKSQMVPRDLTSLSLATTPAAYVSLIARTFVSLWMTIAGMRANSR